MVWWQLVVLVAMVILLGIIVLQAPMAALTIFTVVLAALGL
jgi:hypothetical protein